MSEHINQTQNLKKQVSQEATSLEFVEDNASPSRGHISQNILQLQRTIGNQAVVRLIQSQANQSSHTNSMLIQRNPAVGAARAAAKRALRWMASRYGRTVTQHIARHAVMLAGRVEHTVFRNPNRIRNLIERTLKNPHNILLQQGRRILSGGERELTDQALMYAVEREFGRAIGKDGERILRVIIKRGGEIITAYPVRAFTSTTAGAAAAFVVLDSAVAQAQEDFVQVQVEAQQRLEATEPSFWEDMLNDVLSFGLHGGQLNQGEDVMLWKQREINRIEQQVFEEVLAAAENEAQATLGAEDREQIQQMVRSALMIPSLLEQQVESPDSEQNE
jgi:hypothetical protein